MALNLCRQGLVWPFHSRSGSSLVHWSDSSVSVPHSAAWWHQVRRRDSRCTKPARQPVSVWSLSWAGENQRKFGVFITGNYSIAQHAHFYWLILIYFTLKSFHSAVNVDAELPVETCKFFLKICAAENMRIRSSDHLCPHTRIFTQFFQEKWIWDICPLRKATEQRNSLIGSREPFLSGTTCALYRHFPHKLSQLSLFPKFQAGALPHTREHRFLDRYTAPETTQRWRDRLWNSNVLSIRSTLELSLRIRSFLEEWAASPGLKPQEAIIYPSGCQRLTDPSTAATGTS